MSRQRGPRKDMRARTRKVVVKDIERAGRKVLDGIRSASLKRTLNWVRSIPYHKRRLSNVRTTDAMRDMRVVPFLSKADLIASTRSSRFPAGVRVGTSALNFIGLTGGPGIEATERPVLTVPMTLNDMKLRGETATRAFRAMGAHDGRVLMLEEISHSVVHQVMLRGLIGVGSTPVQLGRGFTLRHVRHTIPRLRPSEIVTHPTYAMFLKDLLDNEGVDLRLKKVMLWGEIGGSIRPFRKRVSEAYGAQVFDLYAMQETGVLAAECEANEGLHGFEDRFHYEVIEPSTGEVLGEGEAGELVVTDLSRTAMPLIRYRTGDVTTIERDRCSCGRTHLRLCGIKGKVEHSLRTKDGGMLLPGDIAELIWSNPHLPGNFKMVPDEGVVVETKIKKDMSKYYLEKFGRPPVNVTFERLMPRFYHRTQYMANGDYERLLKEQMRLEV